MIDFHPEDSSNKTIKPYKRPKRDRVKEAIEEKKIEKQLHKKFAELTVHDAPPEQFEFNILLPAKEHYEMYKDQIVSQNTAAGSINYEYVAQMAKKELEEKGKEYANEAWKDVHEKLRETEIIRDVLVTSIMKSNIKLKPLTNAGFNHKDRRKPANKTTHDPDEQSRLKMLSIRYRHQIDKYKRKLTKALNEKDVFAMDEILQEINSVDDESELHNHLRYDIIKAQLAL